MATWTIRPLSLAAANDSHLSYHVRSHLEASSQTFLRDSPVIYSSGLIAIAAEPVAAGTLAGFAVKAGQNGTAGQSLLAEFVPAFAGLKFYANFLDDDGTTRNIAAADFGVAKQMHVSSVGSHLGNTATVPALFKIINGQADETLSDGTDRAFTGDTDARVLCEVLEGACVQAVIA